MQSKKSNLDELTLVGITQRTNNRDEMNPETAKIGDTVGRYFGGQLHEQIQHRSRPMVTYCVYTEFESDEHGEYTYFIGEAVDSLDGQDLSQFKTITIPASQYQKFTTDPGKMPDVVISAWQKLWQMNEHDFGGKRSYVADFEVYDERAADPENTVLDIYIGID